MERVGVVIDTEKLRKNCTEEDVINSVQQALTYGHPQLTDV